MACPCASKAASSSCACKESGGASRYDEAFLQLIPQKVARKLAKQGVTPPQLEQIVGESRERPERLASRARNHSDRLRTAKQGRRQLTSNAHGGRPFKAGPRR